MVSSPIEILAESLRLHKEDSLSRKEDLIPESEVFLPWKEPKSPVNYRTKPKPRKIVDMGIRQLPAKHRQALENILKNPEKPRQAVIDAGFNPDHATDIANRLLQRKPIINAIENKGGTDEKIAEAMMEGMTKAENPFRPGLPDHNVRLGYVKEINRIKDNYPPTKISTETRQKSIHIHFTAENITQFEKYNQLRRGSKLIKLEEEEEGNE